MMEFGGLATIWMIDFLISMSSLIKSTTNKVGPQKINDKLDNTFNYLI